METKTNSEAAQRNPSGKAIQDTHRNPVCLEVVVGIRNLPSGPRIMEAHTVIVFETGAVLRLAADPPVGQELIVVHPRGQEAACRVIAPQNRPAMKGYVEIEFTKSLRDFWGIQQTPDLSNIRPTLDFNGAPSTRAPSQPGRSISAPSSVKASPSVEQSKHIGHAPTFEDISDLALDEPIRQPKGSPTDLPSHPKVAEMPLPVPEPSVQVSVHTATQLADYVPPVSNSLTGQLSALRGGTAKPLVTPTHISQGKSLADAYAGLPMADLPTTNKRKPLFIGGAAAVVLVAGAAGFFLIHKTPSMSASAIATPAVVASAQQNPSPSLQIGAASVAQDPAPASPAAQAPASDLTDASLAASTPSDPGSLIRSATQTSATFAGNTRTKPDDAPAVQKHVNAPNLPSLKIKTPTMPNRNSAKLSDGSNFSAAEIGAANPAASLAIGSLPTSSNAPAPPRPVLPPTPAKAVVQEPKLMSSINPIYPLVAKQNSVQGDVVIMANIDPTGKVGEMAVVSGPEMLRRAAVDAVRQWKYQPATNNGIAVASQVSVKVQFRIR